MNASKPLLLALLLCAVATVTFAARDASTLTTYYDSNGKVVWVSDGYVAQALLPQVPVPFAVDLPPDVAKNVQTYRVVVNHYDNAS